MSISDVRRQNLKLLAEQHGGQAGLSRATGKAPAYISQLFTGLRNLGEAGSRNLERSLGLPNGWLDCPRTASESLAPFPSDAWAQLGPEARSLILTIVEFFRLNGGLTNSDEAQLISAYRACSPEARAVVLSVAHAQAATKVTRKRRSK